MIKLKIFFKKVVKLFIYITSPIFLILIIMLSPFVKIRFGLLSSHRVGEIALNMEIYLMNQLLEKKNKSKKIDLFILVDIIANQTYVDLIKKKVIIITNSIGHPIYKILKFFTKKNNFFNQFIIDLHDKDYNLSFSKTKSQLDVDDSFIKKGNEFLKKLNIRDDAKIICLIVRDNNYLNSKFSNKDWSRHNHRDCTIANFEMAVNFAIKEGYYVFHMGENMKNYLSIKNKNFIQYAKKYRTDFLDLYLAYKCEFCITTGTGWDILPGFTFRKPIVWTNALPAGDPISFSHKFIFSIKLHYDNKKKKFLSLKEIFDLDLSFKFGKKDYDNKNISLIENKPDEIKNMTEEMINYLNNNITYSSEEETDQNKLWETYEKYFGKRYGKNINSFSRMSKYFLSKNKFLISV